MTMPAEVQVHLRYELVRTIAAAVVVDVACWLGIRSIFSITPTNSDADEGLGVVFLLLILMGGFALLYGAYRGIGIVRDMNAGYIFRTTGPIEASAHSREAWLLWEYYTTIKFGPQGVFKDELPAGRGLLPQPLFPSMKTASVDHTAERRRVLAVLDDAGRVLFTRRGYTPLQPKPLPLGHDQEAR
jgi:hypothetical protein